MNVLQINQSDLAGGAAIAAYRLHQGLSLQGVESRLLVGGQKTNSDRVATVPRKLRLENQLSRFNRLASLNYLNIISSFDIPKHPFYQEADLLHFHNLHAGYFNYLALPALTQDKPAVWTLHDMWSFTGHCAYSYDCDRWKIGCGKCPYPKEYPEIQRDSTRVEWYLKRWVYRQANLAIATPSQWLTQQVRQSMLSCFPVHHIPYGIDLETYQPLDSQQCRSLLGIAKGKRVLMFVAENLADARKGGNLLIQSLAQLPVSLKAETVLLTLGNGGEAMSEAVEMDSVNLGYVGSDRLKTIAYSAADLFLFPTRADNLPLVLQESMACGTPMVSFKIGGVPDLVRLGVTGYLAQPEDPGDFARGIVQLWEDDSLRDRLSQNCRAIATQEYSLEKQTQRYIDLYHQRLEN